jgi:O-antigen/teichoic acid export membrane protein
MTSSVGGLGSRRVTGDIAAQILGRVLDLALGIVVTVALVRYLGDADYGKWATIMSITTFITVAGSLTLPRVVIPKAAAEPEREGSWLAAMVQLQAWIAVPGTLIAIVVVLLISRGGDMVVAGLIASLLVLLNLPNAVGTVFQLHVRNDVTTVLSLLNSLIWTVGVFIVAAVGGGLPAIAAVFVTATTLSLLPMLVLALRRVHFDWGGGRKLWGVIVKLALPVAAYGMAVNAYNGIDQLIVFSLGGSRDAGLYAAVYRILNQAGVFPAAVFTTLLPILAAAYATTDLPRVHRLMQVATENLMVLAFGGIAVAVAAGEPILELLYGSDFKTAAPTLVILMCAFALIEMGYVFGSMVLVLGIQRRLLKFAVIALAVNVTLNLIFVPIYGYVAAAVVTLITEGLILVLTVRVVAPILEFRLQRGPLLRTAAAAAGMGLIVWGVRQTGVPTVVLLVVAPVAYLILLFAFRALHVRELLSLVRRSRESAPADDAP